MNVHARVRRSTFFGQMYACSLAGVAAPPSQFRIPCQALSARQVPSPLPHPATAAYGDRPNNYDRRCVGLRFARHAPSIPLANTLEPPAGRSQRTAYGKKSGGSGNAGKSTSSASLELQHVARPTQHWTLSMATLKKPPNARPMLRIGGGLKSYASFAHGYLETAKKTIATQTHATGLAAGSNPVPHLLAPHMMLQSN